MNDDELYNRFSYHAPDDDRVAKHNTVRMWTLDLAYQYDELAPDSREKSLAITKLEEAMFWANAAIARNP